MPAGGSGHLRAGNGILPFLSFTVSAIRWFPVQQSEKFAGALKQSVGEEKVRLVLKEGAGDHGKPDYNTREIVEEALDFLDEVFCVQKEADALPA